MTVKTPKEKVDEWNKQHPHISTKVHYTRDGGLVTVHKTRSKAIVLSDHTPVIWLEGISGCVWLDRVKIYRGGGDG